MRGKVTREATRRRKAADMRALRRRRALAAVPPVSMAPSAPSFTHIGDDPAVKFCRDVLRWAELERTTTAGGFAGRAAGYLADLLDEDGRLDPGDLQTKIALDVLAIRQGEMAEGRADDKSVRAGLNAVRDLIKRRFHGTDWTKMFNTPDLSQDEAYALWVGTLSGGILGRAGVPAHLFEDVDDEAGDEPAEREPEL